MWFSFFFEWFELELGANLCDSASAFDVFYKPHRLRLYVLNGITGCVVRRVPESISVLQNRATETRLCEQLALLRCFMERILYTAKHLRSTFYLCRHVLFKSQVGLHFYTEVSGLLNAFKGDATKCVLRISQ